MKSALFAVALVLVSASASAQVIHTTVSVEGRKIFSDRPDTLPDPEAEAEVPAAASRTPAGTMAKGSRGAALVNAKEAERRLAQAQLKRARGMPPLATERIQAGGSIALNHRYWKRQEALRLQVEQAQQRLNATRQPQLARR